jgi:hypothetical protein
MARVPGFSPNKAKGATMEELARAARMGDCGSTRGSRLLIKIAAAEFFCNEKAMTDALAVLREAVNKWDWKFFEEIASQMKEFAKYRSGKGLPRSRQLYSAAAEFISLCEGPRVPFMELLAKNSHFFGSQLKENPFILAAIQRPPFKPTPHEVFEFLETVDPNVSRKFVAEIMKKFGRSGKRGAPRGKRQN